MDVRDFKSKALFAFVVKGKGSDEEEYSVQCLVNDVLWVGYGEMRLCAYWVMR